MGWEYLWDEKTQTGRAVLSPFAAKLHFREHYSVLQRARHHKLRIKDCSTHLIRPVYDFQVSEDLKKLRFDFSAEHYVHYFVGYPPFEGRTLRLCYVCGQSQKGEHVWLKIKNGKPKFEVNTVKIDEAVRRSLIVKGTWQDNYWIPHL